MADDQGKVTSFFEEAGVEKTTIPVGDGVPFGVKRVTNEQVGIGGAYGTWGDSYDNEAMSGFLEKHLGQPVPDKERLNLAELGFRSRHHIPPITDEQNVDVEVQVGARLLREAMQACGWEPREVD